MFFFLQLRENLYGYNSPYLSKKEFKGGLRQMRYVKHTYFATYRPHGCIGQFTENGTNHHINLTEALFLDPTKDVANNHQHLQILTNTHQHSLTLTNTQQHLTKLNNTQLPSLTLTNTYYYSTPEL